MIKLVLVLLVLSSVKGGISHDVSKNEKKCKEDQTNEPLTFKLTKSIDLKVEGNADKWNATLNDLIQAQIHCKGDNPSESSGTSVTNPIPPKQDDECLNNENDQINILNRLDALSGQIQIVQNNFKRLNCNYLHSYSSEITSELCKNLIGTSKTPTCRIIDNKYFEEINNNNITLPKSCNEIKLKGQKKSGVYEIQPTPASKPIRVLCDMETHGGGWTHIQRRVDGSEDFYREWRDYKFGFGDLSREFWLGLENIYRITGFQVNELLVEIVDRDRVKAYALYKAFGIGPEIDGYNLNVLRGFSGDAGDSLSYHAGQKFTTKDMDQDVYNANCAQSFLGAWWYKDCHISNLNGKYVNLPLSDAYKFQGLHWKTFRGHEYCHSSARMLVRPAEI